MRITGICLSILLVQLACRSEPIPFRRGGVEPEVRLMWVGVGRAQRFVDGIWKRSPEQDYEFSVRQDRFSHRWESIKNMHRRHPEYDGSAGPRNQTHFFLINYANGKQGSVESEIESSLGPGNGTTDLEFRRAEIELSPEISSLAPYNRIRITQRYEYESGLLHEMVYLYDLKDGREVPFFRVEEQARIYTFAPLSAAPTVWSFAERNSR